MLPPTRESKDIKMLRPYRSLLQTPKGQARARGGCRGTDTRTELWQPSHPSCGAEDTSPKWRRPEIQMRTRQDPHPAWLSTQPEPEQSSPRPSDHRSSLPSFPS